MQLNQMVLSRHLDKSLLNAGHLGCVSLGHHLNYMNEIEFIHEHLGGGAIQVIQKSVLLKLLSSKRDTFFRMKKGSSALWTKTMAERFSIHKGIDWSHGAIQINGQPNWKRGDLFIVADCSHLAILTYVKTLKCVDDERQVCTVSFEPLKEKSRYEFQPTALVGRLKSEIFFISDSQRIDTHQNPIWSLYKAELGRHSMELLSGLKGWEFEVKTKSARDDWAPAIDLNQDILAVLVKADFYSVENECLFLNRSDSRFEQAWAIRHWA